MHMDLRLVIFNGLTKLKNPSNAPYGQRYRHQKFLITMDKAVNAKSVHSVNDEMFRKGNLACYRMMVPSSPTSASLLLNAQDCS